MCKPNQNGLPTTSTRCEAGTTAATGTKTHCHQHHHDGSTSLSSWKMLIAKDDSLLLKACLNYAWKDVIQCCSTLLSMLLLEESISTESSTESFLSTSMELIQRQLSQRDPWGNTPLLAACHYDPPVVVVRMLLVLASKVSMEIHTSVNSIGASPLVIICNSGGGRRRGKTLALLSLLLQQLEQDQQVPLSALTDKQGNSVFQGLLNRYQLLCKIPKFSKVHCTSLDDVSAPLRQKEQENCFTFDYGEELFDTFWTTVQFLIQAASRPGWTLLHGAACLAPLLPPEITRFIARYHCSPQQHEKEEGNNSHTSSGKILPFHMAVCSYEALHRRENINHNALQIWKHQTEYFVQQLLVTDPSAATTRHSQHGRLPWTQAIASGLSWNSTTATTTTTTIDGNDDKTDDQMSDFSSSSLLQHLLQVYPPALEEQDPCTGLDPAFLAGAAAPTTTYSDDKEDTKSLDTIYSLLRLNPTVVRKGA
eukprot:scaffold4911_cov100-Cylindrotheca_fusiformis.AAC.1